MEKLTSFLTALIMLSNVTFAQTMLLPDGRTVTSFEKSSANNTPVINIAAPSGRGVSHNTFKRYNVGPDNLILNNSREKTDTKIGGEILANPNLVRAGKEAQIILNEVINSDPTLLNGYTEVAGKGAEVIIANPHGISVAGAGFINTPSVTLVTGSSRGAGKLGFDIHKTGRISVGEGGLVNEDGALTLSGRYINIDGEVHAQEINIFTGNNIFDYETKTVTSTGDATPPEFAVDALRLGAMYAGQINIIGTEKGFGVRTHGALISDLGGINITNAGDVEFGDMQSAQNLNISAAGDIEGGAAYAADNINIEAANAAKNLNLSSQADITINAADIDYSLLQADGAINMTAAQNVTHAGKAAAGGDINITAAVLQVNSGKSLLSHGNMNLNAGTLSNYGEIISFGNINIVASGAVSNGVNGEIAGYGDVTLYSSGLVNDGLILSNSNLNIFGGNLHNNAYASMYGETGLTIKTDGIINNYQANIYSGGNLEMSGMARERIAGLNNTGGLIESINGDVIINADDIKNLSIDNCNPAVEVCHTNRRYLTGERAVYPIIQSVIYEAGILDTWLQAAALGRILAGNDIIFNAVNVLNRSASISAGRNLNAYISGNFTNDTTSYMAQNYYTWERLNIGGSGSFKGIFYTTEYYNDRVQSLTPGIISAKSIYITSGLVNNGIAGDAGYMLPPSPLPENKQISDIKNSGVVPDFDVDFSFNGLFKPAAPDSEYLYTSTNRFIDSEDFVGAADLLEKIGLTIDTIPPTLLPTPSEDPSELEAALASHEAAPHKAEQQNIKFLGDAYFEQKLIEDAISRLTGSRYLFEHNGAPLTPNEQIARLHDNALDAYSDLGLVFGVGLTQDQINALAGDIVWYVAEEVNGVMAYVPKLYLSQATRDALDADSHSAFRGENLKIDADTINNNGNITGTNIELMAENNLNNSGSISGGDISLSAGNDINNIGGLISGAGNVGLNAGGNINNVTLLHTATWGNVAYGATKSWLGDSAVIEGGAVSMSAGNDVNIKAAGVFSAGDTDISAGNDVNIGVQTLVNSSHFYSKKRKTSQDSTTNAGSLLVSGGDMNITAGRDLTVQASAVGSMGDMTLNAEDDINILSAVDESHSWDYSKKKKSFGRAKIDETREDKTWHVGSNLISGGDMTLNAGKDINVLASSLESIGGDMLLDAERDINILAGTNTQARLERHEKKGFAGLNGKKDMTYDEIITLEASSAFSGNNITMKSGNDTTVYASDVGAAGDGSIITGGDFNLLAGIESTYHYEEHWKRDFNPVNTMKAIVVDTAKNATLNGATGGNAQLLEIARTGRFEFFDVPLYTETTDTSGNYQETARGSNLSVGGSLSIDSQKDVNITGSEVYAREDIDITAENINITAQELKSSKRKTHEEKNVSLNSGLSNAYLDSAKKAIAVTDAAAALSEAEKAYSQTKKLYDEGKVDRETLLEAEKEMLSAGADLATKTAEAAKAVTDAAGSAGTSLGTGMTVDANLNVNITGTTSDSATITQQGSTIHSETGNITLTARNDINQEGSSVISGEITDEGLTGGGDITYTAGGDVNITGAMNLRKDSNSKENKNLKMGVNSGGSANIGYNQSKSKNKTNDTWWTNSQIATGDGAVTITSGDDTTVSGANIKGKDVTLNVGGDLVVESLQDTHSSNGRSSGFGSGLKIAREKDGTGKLTPDISFNIGGSEKNSSWTNEQTTIIGTDSITVNADTTHIKGAVIANITEDGADGGNLTLNTNKLTYEDLHDYDYSGSYGFGLKSNLPISLDENETASLDKILTSINDSNGKTTIDGKYASSEKEQETRATVGEGQITTGSSDANLPGLNRDINKSQEKTKDRSTRISGDLIFDHEKIDKMLEDSEAGSWDAVSMGVIEKIKKAVEETSKIVNPKKKEAKEEKEDNTKE